MTERVKHDLRNWRLKLPSAGLGKTEDGVDLRKMIRSLVLDTVSLR